MGRRHYRHPEAVLTEMSERAAARKPKDLEQVWAITFCMRSGERRRTHGGHSRDEASARVQAVFDCDDHNEYESAWIRRIK